MLKEEEENEEEESEEENFFPLHHNCCYNSSCKSSCFMEVIVIKSWALKVTKTWNLFSVFKFSLVQTLSYRWTRCLLFSYLVLVLVLNNFPRQKRKKNFKSEVKEELLDTVVLVSSKTWLICLIYHIWHLKNVQSLKMLCKDKNKRKIPRKN